MSFAKRFIAFSLALVVFVSSGGVVLAVHYCSKKADKEVFIFNNNTCCDKTTSDCGENGVTDFVKGKCCDLKISYHKVDISSICSENHQLDLVNSIVDNFSGILILNVYVYLKTALTNKAPPFLTGGKTFLYFSHLLLI